jgi:RNA polymerase sigma-70 factor (ECF subfamily)
VTGTVHPLFPRGARTGAASARGAHADDAALLARVAHGDPAAHRALFERYHARVASFLRRRLRDPGLCEEVASDVFFEIWRSAGAYRGESSVPSWIFGIAHFKALSARRHQAQLKRSSVVPTHDDVIERAADESGEASFEARDEMRKLLGALDALPQGQREVVALAFLEGVSYQEISDRLGITEGNVKTRVNRARARLRALLGRERGDT